MFWFVEKQAKKERQRVYIHTFNGYLGCLFIDIFNFRDGKSTKKRNKKRRNDDDEEEDDD